MSPKSVHFGDNPQSLPQHVAQVLYLKNDLRRRDCWGEKEVDEVIAMIEVSP